MVGFKSGINSTILAFVICYTCNSESAKESVPRARTRQGFVCLPLKKFHYFFLSSFLI